ncbi:DUF3306 domain-containing protein [Ramlibacter sp.]|uniref:DUF3306 domain-containing protein n=1 Tax=Ramlibacter sp. TaxID=1917967 RepID=UPI00262BF941|nr:DUF3306 domain-containing protein [Ramlibacter sp.]MDB5957657.1 hypothetical protein [Ramlibacter sp.]
MAEGFLGRWAKRKEAVRKGEAVPDEVPLPSPQPSPPRGEGARPDSLSPPLAGKGARPDSLPLPLALARQGAGLDSLPLPLAGEGRGEGTALQQAPPPTLADTQELTPTSDFTRFVRPGVAPEVKNAALKKLFADPHFHVMDGLDVYIDDYNKSDPIPPEMLRQLVGARFLGLFEDEEQQAAEDPPPQSVAQSDTAQALPPAEHDGDPDLRLQQDDAAGPGGPRPGPG